MEDKKIIIVEDKTFPASKYQEKIFDFIEKGCGNLVVNASAGSAKTTTIVNCMRFIPKGKKVLFVSFNKHIATELTNRIGNDDAQARTCSSVGFEICRENGVALGEVDNEKYPNFIRNNILSLTEFGETESLGRSRSTYMRNISQLVDLCRYTLCFTLTEIEHLASKYGIVPIRDEFAVCRKILEWGKENCNDIDQTDMVWLPSVLNLNTRKLLSDFIFIDEAQDITMAQRSLILLCKKRGARVIAVGDRNQQINIWCGSDEEAIDTFRKEPNTIELALPICYRCGKNIIEKANEEITEKMLPAPGAADGQVNYGVSISEIREGDMVLSRNTAPLISLQLALLRMNRKVYIQGFKEIKEDILHMINNTNSTRIDRGCVLKDGLFTQLYECLFEDIDKIASIPGMDEEETLSHPSVLYQYDNICAIKALSEGLETVEQLVDKINIIFNDTSDKAVLLATVHRAKGLEADRVFIYKPSILINNRLATKDWEIKTEKNLRYVAYTRAKSSLNFLEEEKFYWKKNPYSAAREMTDDLKNHRVLLRHPAPSYKPITGKTEEIIVSAPVITRQGMEISSNKNGGGNKKAGGKFFKLIKNG